MIFILAHKIEYYVKIEIILYINSKPYEYFLTKDAIKLYQFKAGSQIFQRKNNSNINNYQSQIA